MIATAFLRRCFRGPIIHINAAAPSGEGKRRPLVEDRHRDGERLKQIAEEGPRIEGLMRGKDIALVNFDTCLP